MFREFESHSLRHSFATSQYYPVLLSKRVTAALNYLVVRRIVSVMNSFRYFLLVPLFLVALISEALCVEQSHVLLLNSYHYGLCWTDDETKGIREVLEKSGLPVELHVEYMDTKRLSDEAHFRNLHQLLDHKYRNTRFSSILVTDNDAFDFLRKYRNDPIFSGIPVIFAGVNYFHKEMLEGLSGFTGVAETFEGGQTVEVMKRLHPNVRRIVIIIDSTITGQSIRKDLEPMLTPFTGKIEFEFWDKLSLAQLRERLPKLEKETLVLLMPFARDIEGTYIRYSDLAQMVSQLSSVPVYGTYEFYMGYGIIGGRLTSGEAQGQAAANILLHVLNGESPDKIPVVTVSPSEFQFDSRQLHRYEIANSDLPSGSKILFQTWYELNRTWVWLGGLFFLITVWLGWNWGRTRYLKKISDKALRESDAKLLTVLDCSSNAIFLIRSDGSFTYVNRQAELMLDYSKAELLKMGIKDTVPPNELERSLTAFQNNLTGTHEFFETILIRRDGSRIVVEINGVLLPGGEVLGEIRNITQRKQAELAIKHSKDELAAILNATTESIFLIDSAGIILALNKIAASRFNSDPTKMISQSIFDFFPVEVLDSRRDYIAEVFRTGKEKYTEDKRGEYYFSVNYYPIIDCEGKVESVVIYAADITERHGYQLRLERLLAEQKTLLENDLVGIVTVKDRKIVWANPAFEKMLGYDPGELAGKPTKHNYPSEGAYQSFGAAAYPILTSGNVFRTQIEHVRKEGKHIWVDISGSILNRETGESLWGFVDITERMQFENALRESEEKLRGLYELSPLGIALTDMNGKYVEFNESFRRICGYPEEELKSLDYWTLTPKKYEAEEARQLKSLSETGHYGPYEKEYLRKDGTLIPICLNGLKILGSDGKDYIWSIVEDISKRKLIENELRESHQQTHTLLNSMAEGAYGVDTNGNCTFVNQSFLHILGYQHADEIIGKHIHELIHHSHPEGSSYPATECKMYNAYRQNQEIHTDDEVFWTKEGIAVPVEYWSRPIIVDNVMHGAIATFIDITERRHMEEQVHQLAFFDPLTKLPNRRLLNDRVHQAIANCKRTSLYGALMFLDLDNFKPLNDAHGHDVGDLLLVEVARRIISCIRETDTVSRFGGDEFVIVLSELDKDETKSASQTRLIAEKIRSALSEPYILKIQNEGKQGNTVEHLCTASIGAVLFNHSSILEDVFKLSDMAMYRAKELGRNRIVVDAIDN